MAWASEPGFRSWVKIGTAVGACETGFIVTPNPQPEILNPKGSPAALVASAPVRKQPTFDSMGSIGSRGNFSEEVISDTF